MTEETQSTGAAVQSFAEGRRVLRRKLKTLPLSPGVYRMLDRHGDVLYVGKAKALRNRVSTYASAKGLPTRIARMVARTADLVVVTTHTEAEALLLEANLIKRYRPPYNILLRDDKSFPYILIRSDHAWPQVLKHRGARGRDGEYFGPFASVRSVNQTLNSLQRAFLLRSCSDSVLESRSRPCLLYQIKRCAAPCVGRISPEAYRKLADDAAAFLRGKSQAVQQSLSARMREASERLEYEAAASLRDRIAALTQVQAQQGVNTTAIDDADIISAYRDSGQTCVQVFFFRSGQNWGNRAHFPRHDRGDDLAEILAAFIGQFYDNKPPPPLVLVNAEVAERALLEEALSVKAERKVRIETPRRGAKRSLVEQTERNAREALERRMTENASERSVLEAVGEAFGLDGAPERIEVYDNSHIAGEMAVGAMIVAGSEGLMKSSYRKFNIKSETLAPGDDYAMLREVLTRRFGRLMKDDAERARGLWPDLVLIDGGQGQLSAARRVFDELGVEDVALAAIAKGPDRNAGRERFFMEGRPPFSLEERSPALFYLQRLRDEAHRFAIGAHRAKRSAAIQRSRLDEIAGVGPRRKRALLEHFGSARAIANAGIVDLEVVPGVSRALARAIYAHFHEND